MYLSVIIPTHNRCSLLEAAINSVLTQQLATIEVIVCDDGSTEDMSTVRGRFFDAQGRVIWSRTAERHGAQVARNRGMALAQGEALLFMDSDDVLVNSGITCLLQKLEANPNLDYVFGKVIRTDENLEPLAGDLPVGEAFSDLPVSVAGYHWHTMGIIYRKRFLQQVGPWNESLTGSQDWEYQARVKLSGGQGQFVDVVVGYWRQHTGCRVGASNFRPDYVRSVMFACDVILARARQLGRSDRALARKLARKLILHALEWGAHGRIKERRQCLMQAARTVSDDRFYQALVWGAEVSPKCFDSWIRQTFMKR